MQAEGVKHVVKYENFLCVWVYFSEIVYLEWINISDA